jgi:hypothetical protein
MLSASGQLRSLERAYLLDSGKILTTIDTNANGPKFLVVDGGDTVRLCRLRARSFLANYEPELYVYKKCGMTAVLLPSRIYGNTTFGEKGCLVLFDNIPDAVRAEISFTVDGEYQKTASAERDTDGIFVFYYVFSTLNLPSELSDCSAVFYDASGESLGTYEVSAGESILADRTEMTVA